jgi:hypothetical protein
MNDRAKFDDPHLESLLPKVPFTRRGFIASSLASGFALAAALITASVGYARARSHVIPFPSSTI